MNTLGAAAGFEHGDMTIFFLSLPYSLAVPEFLRVSRKMTAYTRAMTGIVLGPYTGNISPILTINIILYSGPVYIGSQFMSSLAIALFLLLVVEIDPSAVFR